MIQTTGLRIAGTAVNDASSGSVDWTNPGNATAEDGSYAECVFGAGSLFGRGLACTNFGFQVPGDAVIRGVRVRQKKSQSVAGAPVIDLSHFLIIGGVTATTGSKTYGASSLWDAALTYADYGGPSDTWNQRLTPAIVNASNFGVRFAARHPAGTASNARVDATWIEVFYERPQAPRVVSVVLRAGRPPHRALIKLDVSAPKYGFVYRNIATASALLRSDHPQRAEIARIIDEYEGNVAASFETHDGYAEWAGFLTSLSDSAGDPFVPLTFADHFIDLDDATAPASGGGSKSSGVLITEALRYAQAIAAPPVYLSLRGVASNSPGGSWTFKGESVLDVIRAMEQQTTWDAHIGLQVTPGDVSASLIWQGPQGLDRRNEDAWEDGKHFQGRRYAAQYRKGITRAVTVVGTGGTRSNVAVKRGSGLVRGRGGSVTSYALQAGTADAAARIGQSRLDAPENASETIRLVLDEDTVDRATLGVGDLRRLRYRVLGQRRESDYKVTGVGYAPGTGLIEITGSILSEATT